MIRLSNSQTELLIQADYGGAVSAFRWNGHEIFRPANDSTEILKQASFPLVPFSGRIAHGQFQAGGQIVKMPPNLPDSMEPHAIHGFGWQSPWLVIENDPERAIIRHEKNDRTWPWHYIAEQEFILSPDGYRHILRMINLGHDRMPAGLGFHPYFPRQAARIAIQVNGRWETSSSGLPTYWSAVDRNINWFGQSTVDHAFSGRQGDIHIHYPDYSLTISPSDDLGYTVIYIPEGEEFFCIEPVSHMPDAVNRPESADITGLRWLQSGETWSVSTTFSLNHKK